MTRPVVQEPMRDRWWFGVLYSANGWEVKAELPASQLGEWLSSAIDRFPQGGEIKIWSLGR